MYPTAARPRFTIAGKVYQVIDVCEQGLRYRADAGACPALHDPVEGLLRFRRGEETKVRGTVVRVNGLEIALQLSLGVPLRIVQDEQRYLREHHRGSA